MTKRMYLFLFLVALAFFPGCKRRCRHYHFDCNCDDTVVEQPVDNELSCLMDEVLIEENIELDLTLVFSLGGGAGILQCNRSNLFNEDIHVTEDMSPLVFENVQPGNYTFTIIPDNGLPVECEIKVERNKEVEDE